MELYYKSKDGKMYFILPEDVFFCNKDQAMFAYYDGICQETKIMDAINENKEGFFDFSKSLVDVGSDDGDYPIFLNFNHNYIFEPNKFACCRIYANLYLKNKVYNSDVFNIGLGDKEDEYVLFNGFSQLGSPTWESSKHIYNTEYQIKKTTLDSFNIDNIGLIKIDTEGFDYDVIKGAIKTIERNNYPPILYENWDIGHYGWTKKQHDRINYLLQGLGYEIIEGWCMNGNNLAIKK